MERFLLAALLAVPPSSSWFDLPADVLRDKIRGGFLGQVLGDLNGLEHEMKYIAEPGKVADYTPALPEGAWTDDDTDFEWVYIVEMQRSRTLMLAPRRIAELWKRHINRRFWCANEYARQLMDLGIEPPLTGNRAINPWSEFNISGQFVSESFGLMSPGMPRRAAQLGLNYTHATIDGEPAQATQLFTAMIATAFVTADTNAILDGGFAALDSRSILTQIVRHVRKWHRQNPEDWRTTRRLIKETYTRFGGAERDRNGHELNTAAVIGALLYGNGDFIRTAIAAFNFGWDADNNAATACTIVGVQKGYRWMMGQKWKILDKYRNTSRDDMPENETIVGYADRIVALAEQVILESGGRKETRDGKVLYRISLEKPGNIEPLSDPEAQAAKLRDQLRPQIERAISDGADTQAMARSAYLALCLDLGREIAQDHPAQWEKALAALQSYPKVMQLLFFPRIPSGESLRAKAVAAGLVGPPRQEKIW
jgi:ADP-ribosylglycohydrolase